MRPIFLMILLSLCFELPAQNLIPRFETLGVNEGLSQSSVYSIFQDKQGFMWFGTADGLNRFDGKTIKVFEISGKKVAYSNFIRGNLSEDKQGRLWFSNETGIFCYDPVTGTLQRKVDFNVYRWTEGLLIDAQNILYLVDPAAGIYSYNINTGAFLLTKCRFNYPNFLSVFITTNRKNTIWIKNENKDEICAYNTQTGRICYAKTGFNTFSVFYCGSGKLACTTLKGQLLITDTAMRYDSVINFPTVYGKPANIQDIRTDAYGRLWLSTTDNGLLCYNLSTKKTTVYLHDNYREKSLPINILSSVYVDRADNLWIGTDGAGVCKLDLKPQRFNLFPVNVGDYPSMKDFFIKCFYEDEKGGIWFGTQSNGLNRFDPKTGALKNFNIAAGTKNGVRGNIVSSIFKDRQGLMWIAHNTGLVMYDDKHNTFKQVPLRGLPAINQNSAFIYKMAQMPNGGLLAATDAGLLVIQKKSGFYTGQLCDLKPYNYVLLTDLVIMPDQTIWITSPVRGLMHYRREKDRFVLMDIKFPSIDLRSIHQDELNPQVLWLSTGVGLIQYNTRSGAYKRYDKSSGLTDSYVYGVLEDEHHNFWMSTNNGLYFFNRKSRVFQNYTMRDGLQSNEFNTQAFYKGPGGTLYFGGIKGFNWFNPQDIKAKHATVPGVAITDIEVDNKPYIKDKRFITQNTIVLPYDRNDLSFRFAALDFTRPQANQVRFILRGWDKEWNLTDDQAVRYANLQPGRYHLRVMASNSDGAWSRQARLTIVISTPFWQAGWFYAGASLTALAIIIYVTYLASRQKIRKKLRELEKQQAINDERNRISRDMHDEIGSGLTHIALLSEMIDARENTSPAVKNDAGNIATAARKLVDSMSEIIWALNPQNDLAENLLAYTREQMQYYYGAFDFKLSIDFPADVPQIKLSNEQRRNLYLVTKEGLNNVLKHAAATQVTLRAGFTDNLLNFEISDNGRGLNGKAGKITGNGCKNMRKRMEEIGGHIEWINSAGGLSVRYWLKGQ